MQGGVCGQLMLGTILPDPRGGVVVSTDLRLRHRVAFIIDELDALRDALIHLLILLLLVTRALRDETRVQPSLSARDCLIWDVHPQRGILRDNHPRNSRSR